MSVKQHHYSSPSHDGKTKRETFLRGLGGAVILLVVIAAAEMPLFGASYFDSLPLHPFWIVIVIAAMQNGVGVGIATSVIAAILVGFPDRYVGEDAAVFAARAAVLPMQWFVVALIIGFYRQKEIAETSALQDDVVRLESVSHSLACEVDRMDAMVVDMERKAAARPAQNHDTNAQEVAFQRALPELAALAGSQGMDLPHTFEQAGAALLDGPVALIVMFQGRGELIIGSAPKIGKDPTSLAKMILEALKKQNVTSATIGLTDLSLSGNDALRVSCQRPTSEKDMTALVIFHASDHNSAEAAAGRVETMSELSRIAIERLSHNLEAGEGNLSASWDRE